MVGKALCADLILIKADRRSARQTMIHRRRSGSMKPGIIALSALAAVLAATDASAQVLNLSGQYQCIQGCMPPNAAPAFVTQNGWDLNLVNEIGQPSRAWVDYPGHIWAEYWHEGAVISPDGLTIQFDSGSVWQRIILQPVISTRG
jgi:hypothetical protein